jgi:hypothetical protein
MHYHSVVRGLLQAPILASLRRCVLSAFASSRSAGLTSLVAAHR